MRMAILEKKCGFFLGDGKTLRLSSASIEQTLTSLSSVVSREGNGRTPIEWRRFKKWVEFVGKPVSEE